MKGNTSIRVGTYALTDDLTLRIRASDDGTVLTIRELPSGKTTTATINEIGDVVRRSNGHQFTLRTSTPDSEPSSETPVMFNSDSRIEILDKVPLQPPPKPRRAPKLIRFNLRYGKSKRRNRPYAVTAFTDGKSIQILYRFSGDATERHLRIEGDMVLIGKQIAAFERLSRSEWAELSTMVEGTNFMLKGRLGLFSKMRAEELRELIEEKTFLVSARSMTSYYSNIEPPRVLPTSDASPVQQRRKFKTRQVSVLKCEPANFDHADGEPATAITIAHKDSVEPLTIDLATTRTLVVNLLISLWTADDEFAESVLEKFPVSDGVHFWPKEE